MGVNISPPCHSSTAPFRSCTCSLDLRCLQARQALWAHLNLLLCVAVLALAASARGKLLNVRDATALQISENQEIQHIKQILGLQHGKTYDDVKALRYGHLMIMTDQVRCWQPTPPLLQSCCSSWQSCS